MRDRENNGLDSAAEINMLRSHPAMARDVVYFDLETQRTANDAGGWGQKRNMGMSIGVTYSTKLGEYRIYTEKTVDDLVQQLMRADLVVGFNVINFDYEVLMAYTAFDLTYNVRT